MNEQESQSNDYLHPPLWHGKLAFGKVSLRLTLQKREAEEKSVQHFRQVSLLELDEPFEQKFPVIRRRLLVLSLYLSFLACVTGLWLTANVTNGLAHKLPARIMNFIVTQPVVVLLVPLLILLGCYFLLRHITYDIIAWPERFLDERQQIVRDKAHRNAYKIVKVACLLIPFYLCLHAVLWTAQAPAPASPQAYTLIRSSEYVTEMAPNALLQGVQMIQINPAVKQVGEQSTTLYWVVSSQPILSIKDNGSWTIVSTHATTPSTYLLVNGPMYPIYTIHTMILSSYGQAPVVEAPSWPNAPACLLLYYGTLLLSLLLLATALPMSLVAWKERL